MRRILSVLALACTIFLSITLLSSPTSAGPRSAVSTALAQVDDPYVYGANGPGAFDCSGLVQYAFKRAGYKNVPRTAQGQYNRSRHISRSSMRRGDLLFYHTRSGHVYHVAIYLGHGRVVEAASPSTGIRAGSTWKAARWSGRLRRH